MSIVLGLDSATHTGYGVVSLEGHNEKLLESGRLDLSDHDRRGWTVNQFAKIMLERYPCLESVAIEDNYLDTQAGKGNVRTVQVLARIVGRWEQAFESRGVDTVLVSPQRWAVGLLAGALMNRSSKRETRKAACKLWVRATFGIVPKTDDECDAIGISVWQARQLAFAARVAG